MSSFRKLVAIGLEKVKELQSTLDLSDESSIAEGKEALVELKEQFKQQFADMEAEPYPTEAHRSLLTHKQLTSKVIRSTIAALDRHRSQMAEGKPPNRSES